MFTPSKKSIGNTLLLLMFAGIIFSCKPERNTLEAATFLIDSIKSQTIPDTRVEVFAIKATYTGDAVLLKGKTTRSDVYETILRKLTAQQIPYSDSILLLPDPKLKDKTWGLITLSVANLRYLPAHAAEMATQALMGTPVKVLQEENGWYLIQTPDNYIAWTESAGVQLISESELNQWKSSTRIIYLSGSGLVLSQPEPDALPVSDLVTGGIVVAASAVAGGGAFLSVELPDGRKGYIKRAECRDFETWTRMTRPDSADLLNSALLQMGRPYLWGGTSVKGFDCSGFTKTIYLTGGLILARDASQQVHQGTEIPSDAIWKNLRAGDLLFFGRKPTSELTERVSHVGMYIGESEFIHCSGMIRINSLDSTRSNFKPYYQTNLLHVKRMIGSDNAPVSFDNHPWYR